MSQISKRFISLLITVVMLVSMLPVYTFAANNYVPDEEYYDKIVHDAFIVNSAWAGLTDGAQIEYVYRNELYGSTAAVQNKYSDPDEFKDHYETFDSTIHFSSFEAAYKFSQDNNIINPVIILCPGVYSTAIELKSDVTILGANAGIDPNVKTKDASPWGQNPDCISFTSLACRIDVYKFIENDIEVVFDGIKFINGFVYYEAGINEKASNIVFKNSTFDSISAPVVDRKELSSILYFERAAAKQVGLTFENVRIEKLSETLIGNFVLKINMNNAYYANCTAPLVQDIDALAGASPEYIIQNSMFYNNVTAFGTLVLDHGQKDSTTRTKTYLEISNCIFKDGPDNDANAANSTLPFIDYAVTGAKNIVNIHDCEFIASKEHSVAPVRFVYKSNAITDTLDGSISFNSNKLFGFTTLIDTVGLLKQSKINLTGNYYATVEGKQIDPIYPSSSSYNNIVMDYFWVNSNKTVPSSIYHITSIGKKEEFSIRNDLKTLHIVVDNGEKFDLNLKTNDKSTTYKVYSDAEFTKEITSLDSAALYTGESKNVFYAVGTSTKVPEYKFVYTVYVSTYNPEFAPDFIEYNTYMYSPDVKGLAKGTEICKDWDGTSYKFVVGQNVFATTKEIFDVADEVPTIIIPAGIYTEDFCISESAIVLGAKHGINPNVPDFDNFESGWKQNNDRTDMSKETVFENCSVYIATPSINVTAEIDGITLGEGASFYDIGDKVETHTTTTLKNILLNNAGGATLREKDINGADVVRTSGNVLNFGGSSDDFNKNHKDVRIINIRMENQTNYYLIGTYMESLYIDGLYFSGSNKRIHNAELTAPKTQNFKLEIRNSFFYKCTPSTGVVLVTNKQTDTPEREFNKVIYDHNLFYQPATYLYGVIGIRFNSSRDSFTFTNNTVISTYAAHSLMPGNTGWFTGATACENLTLEQQEQAETVKDVTIKFNRICGPYKPVDKQNVKYDTCWDYSYNYVCDLDADTTIGGNFEGGIFDRSTPGIRMQKYSDSQKNFMKCDNYFADWDMTELVDAPDSFKTELDYEFNGDGVFKKVDSDNYTYTDTVSSSVNTYKFDIKLKTKQASYGVYTDADCTNKVSDTVALTGKTNVFYVRFASYKNTVVKTYKVTITKEISNEANIISIDNHTVTDKEVIAIVPNGTTSLLLKNIKLSDGATYKIFNDKAKTKQFYVTKIDNISTTPIVKYIEVTSQDKSTVKDYVFTIKQGVNTLADITDIQGATKVDDKVYLADIDVNESSFVFLPTYSTGATVTIKNEGREHTITQGVPYLIHNIGTMKMVEISVTSASGNSNTYMLILMKDMSSVDISYIYNMYTPEYYDEFYTQVHTSEFNLIPVFKNPLTSYEIYTDKNCTKLYENDVLYLTKKTNVFYLKATSVDENNSKVYKLTIVTTDPNAKPDLPPAGDEDIDITTIFKDVVKGSWYEQYVEFAYVNGIFDGTSATTFSPQQTMTRAQFVRILANIEGIDVDNNASTQFKDVPSGKWYTGAVKWAYENGIVSGVGDGKFDPDASITREQMTVMTVNFVEKYLKASLPETENKLTFADDSSISSWAKESVYKCQRAGLISGVGENKFAPLNTATRAEGATLFTEFYNMLFEMI